MIDITTTRLPCSQTYSNHDILSCGLACTVLDQMPILGAKQLLKSIKIVPFLILPRQARCFIVSDWKLKSKLAKFHVYRFALHTVLSLAAKTLTRKWGAIRGCEKRIFSGLINRHFPETKSRPSDIRGIS